MGSGGGDVVTRNARPSHTVNMAGGASHNGVIVRVVGDSDNGG